MGSQVYFVHAEAVNLIKIGRSTDTGRRFFELRLISPVGLTVLGVIPGGAEKEAELHRQFRDIRSHGEWFFATKELITFAQYAVLQAAWDAASPRVRARFRDVLGLKSSDGNASGSEHPSADHVSPPARNRTTGSGSASNGGENVNDGEVLKTREMAPQVEQTSLAAREGEQDAASNSNPPKPSSSSATADKPELARTGSGTNLRPSKPLRPHCQNPDKCAGVGHKHCYQCKKAAGLIEAAA